jgi:hypothetical protein
VKTSAHRIEIRSIPHCPREQNTPVQFSNETIPFFIASPL